jgi:hypothetical protein
LSTGWRRRVAEEYSPFNRCRLEALGEHGGMEAEVTPRCSRMEA